MSNQEIAMEAFVKLSHALKNAKSAIAINDSDDRLAWLHGMAFHENSANLIDAINFVDGLYGQIDEMRHGSDDELFDRLSNLLGTVDEARRGLFDFTDELRTEFDEYRKQPPLRKR